MSGPKNEGEGGSPSQARRWLAIPESLIHWLTAAGGVIVVAGFALVVIAVFFRYALSHPLNWADELIGYMVVALVMAGLGSGLLHGHHIGVDIVTSTASPRIRAWLDVWSAVAVLACAIILTASAWQTVEFNKSFGTYSNGHLEIEMWWAQAPMVPGAAILAIAAILRLVSAIGKYAK